ncbi:TrmH family RNA methyltransferase [Paeniglutamicibacter psychrophenolicus]|uniref:TrmH family RNA methyltransferase n=1 Tax=Paeniglutamicibacter psychrophenolicus TaxID=257454 RepID=UPI0027829A71|nr:RNA methyltransferase [Paeniglutamicibacter psychrophenolicus]MDQ0093496.1 tRNA G18 (ribose-2'-O)-methylase SpoU [Paeniglutamicibacter psychrophenolicus]
MPPVFDFEAAVRAAAGPGLGERLVFLHTAQDPRIADYAALSDAALRRQADPANGRYIAEGAKVIGRALAAGHRPRSFFMAPKRLAGLAEVLEAHPGVPVFVGPDEVLEAVTGFHLHRGALAAMHRPAPLELAEVLRTASRVAVLEDMVDHANLGLIFRSAAALGIDAVLLTPRSADPLYRRAVRVSMGAVFQVPWVRLESWPGDLPALSAAGFQVAAMELTDRAERIDAVAALDVPRLALVLGTEGAGVSDTVLEAVDRHVMIPMRPGMDSLNVAAAAAVVFWELRLRTP